MNIWQTHKNSACRIICTFQEGLMPYKVTVADVSMQVLQKEMWAFQVLKTKPEQSNPTPQR